MFCKICGSELSGGSKFCSVCGARLDLDIPFTAETMPSTSRLETFDREDDNKEKSTTVDMDWGTPKQEEPKKKPYSSGIAFDWSSVADEPRKRPVANIRSPWDTKGLDDDEVEMLGRALAPKAPQGTLENAVFHDAQGNAGPDRSRTLTFIDIVKARQQEEQAAHNVNNEFRADFGMVAKPFEATEDFGVDMSTNILPERERERTQGYTDLNSDIVAALERQENTRAQLAPTQSLVEQVNPLEHTPNFEEQLAYIRARRDDQQNEGASMASAAFTGGNQALGASLYNFDEPNLNEMISSRARGPEVTGPVYVNPVFEEPQYTQPQYTQQVAQQVAQPVAQPVAQQVAQPVAQQVAQPVYQPQNKQTLSIEEELAQILGTESTFDNSAAIAAQQSVAMQQHVAPQRVIEPDEDDGFVDIEDEYLNFAPTRRAARFDSVTDEMIAAGLASEADIEVAKPASTSITSEIEALQAKIDELQSKRSRKAAKDAEAARKPEIRRFDEEFTADLKIPVEDDEEYQNDAFEDFDIDEILGKRESIELDFSDEPFEIPEEWKERDFDFAETPRLEETPKVTKASRLDDSMRFDDVDDGKTLEDELAALGFGARAPQTPAIQETIPVDELSSGTRLFEETSAKFESLEMLINQELAALGLDSSATSAVPTEDEMLFSTESSDMSATFAGEPLSFDAMEKPLDAYNASMEEKPLTLEELEENLFADSTPDEDLEATRKIEKFFTLYRKNEEFQHLLDQEYEKLRGGADVATMLEAVDAYERKELSGIPPQAVPPVTTGNIRANIERERAEINARQAAQQAAAGQVPQQIPVSQVITPPVIVEEEPPQAPEKERGGALTVIAIIVAILLAALFVVILILNFAPDSAIAIKVSEWIGKFTSLGALTDISEWLV